MKQKTRKSFVADSDTEKRLNSIKSRVRFAGNESAVIRLAVEVLDDLLTHVLEDGDIILQKKDGSTRKFSPLFRV